VTAHSNDDLLWRHLKSLPAFRALLRAVEARFYRHLDLQNPILDLGCGDGHFAQMAFDRPLAVGADPWWGPLQKARSAGVYRLNVQAMGDALPFPDRSFATVISNSVLEHIEDVQPVLNEANRVLRPGGRLVVTMPSHLFTQNLGGARLLGPLGLGDAYRDFFNFISRHAHTDPPQQWAERMGQAGFRIARWQYYFSPEALHTLELGHLQGLPSAVLHALTGHWIVAPWRENLRLTERWVRPFYEEEPAEEGAYLFIVAQKVADGPVAPHLPPSNPLTISEPLSAPTPDSPPATEGGTGELALNVYDVEPLSEELQTPATPPVPGPAQTPASGSGLGLLQLLLLGLAVFLAILAQGALSPESSSAWGGFYLYGLSFLALGAALYYRRTQAPEAGTTRGSLPPKRLLFPLALLFSLMAQNLAGNTLSGGQLLPSLLFWLVAIGLGYYSLAPVSEAPPANESPDDAPAASLHENNRLERLLARPILVSGGLFLFALIVRLVLLTQHPAMLNGVEASIGLDVRTVLSGFVRNPFATAWLTNPTFPLFLIALPLSLFGPTTLGIRILSAIAGAVTIPLLYFIARRLWDNTTALVAALLLGAYHLHLHYSRLGMTNIWDPLLALLAFGLLGLALQRGTRRSWLAAGIATGASAYFFTPSRLMPFFLIGVALYLLVFNRSLLRGQGRNILAAVGLALVVALPQIIYFNANPGLFMERAQILGILHNDWLLGQVEATGQTPFAILAQQFWSAVLAFHRSLDVSSSYNPGIPLLRFWPAIFFTIGLGVSIAHIRRFRAGLLLVWLAVTLLFAAVLLVDSPDSHRLLIAAPAVILLVSHGLVWLARQIVEAAAYYANGPEAARSIARGKLLPVVLVIAVLLALGDLWFYFGEYRTSQRFGDRNTEIAFEMAQYLDQLDGDWTAYFHGAPSMYVTFPTIPYLAGDQFRTNENLFDVEDPSAPLPGDPDADDNLVFIYVPERSGEINRTAEQYPEGTFQTFSGSFADPLFYAYEVRR
jgi:SAM-dependent methyltransferase/4-amino-4-deoxy-L-arabinose transferase-like glycosyltransferase